MSSLSRIALLIALALPVVGCGKKESAKGPPPRVEPTAQDRQLLRVYGVRNPYSRRGQAMIRKWQKDRADMEKMMEKRREMLAERGRAAPNQQRQPLNPPPPQNVRSRSAPRPYEGPSAANFEY